MDVVSTGNASLDRILGGGFSPGSLVVIAGPPGTGKTILAQQIAFSNATEDHPALYYTTLSEPHSKLVRHLEPFDFFDRDALGKRVDFLHVTELLQGKGGREDGLEALVEEIVEQAFERQPSFVVLDSAKAIHHFADPDRLREVVFSLANRVAHTGSVLVLVGEYTEDEFEEAPEFAVADGIVQVAVSRDGPVDRRWLRVVKLRGRDFLGGQHTFRISPEGYNIFPRLETIAPTRSPVVEGRHPFGLETLDEMSRGGLPSGQSTVVMGPSGSGKTILASTWAAEGLRQGDRVLYLSLEETVEELRSKAASFELGFEEGVERGDLELMFVPPMELEVDEVGGRMMRCLQELEPARVVIDGLGDLIPEAKRATRFPSYLWALTSMLREHGASVVFTYEITALGGGQARLDALSYLFHNVFVLRYMERGSELGRVMNILKMRSSDHDKGLLQFDIADDGIRTIGDPGDVSATLGWTVLGRATGE